MHKNETTAKIWTAPFISIFTVNLVMQMGQFMTNTIVPRYVDFLGGSSFIVGIVGSAFAVSTLAMRPVIGASIDSFNKKKLLIVAEGLIVLAFIIYRFADSVPLLIFGRAVHGLGAGTFSPLAITIVSGCLPKERMASGIGVFALGQAFSMALGPNIGLFLIKAVGYNAAFVSSACLILASILLVIFLPDGGSGEKKHFSLRRDNIFDRKSLSWGLVSVCSGFMHSCISMYIALYGAARGVEEIGLYFTSYAAALLMSRPISGAISDKLGYRKSLIPAFLCCIASFVMIGFSDSLFDFIIAGALSAFGQGTVTPNIQAHSMRNAPPERSGVIMNTLYAGMDAGMLIGGPLAGLICEQFIAVSGSTVTGYSRMFFAMTVPALIGMVTFLVADRKEAAEAAEGERQ